MYTIYVIGAVIFAVIAVFAFAEIDKVITGKAPADTDYLVKGKKEFERIQQECIDCGVDPKKVRILGYIFAFLFWTLFWPVVLVTVLYNVFIKKSS
ncbi:hypothetical protein ZPAH1_orf00130 [Aeromonas phage ZPAH1]|nr:hypothetical protein ZPAH1_orf00130 [Aeromonas phage ZPAH1]